MTDLRRSVGDAVIELSVQNHPAADSRAQGHSDKAVDVAPRALPPLSIGGGVGVVVQRSRQSNRILHQIAEREIAPAEVGSADHRAGLAVERTRRSDPDAGETLGSAIVHFHDFLDRVLDHSHDSIHDELGAALRLGALGAKRNGVSPRERQHAHVEVRAADVDSDDPVGIRLLSHRLSLLQFSASDWQIGPLPLP